MRATGIDAGSTTFKAVLVERLDGNAKVLARVLEDSDPRVEAQVERALQSLRKLGRCELGPIVATGYGRKRVPGAERVLTEITCHARGAFAALHKAGVLLEVGGQDSKYIRLGPLGEVLDFRMNDRCSAGTGRFLEVMLSRLGVPYNEVGERVRQAARSIRISSTCTVFAETEVISLLAQGEPLEVILHGLHTAFAEKMLALMGRPPENLPVWMGGGVALNEAMVQILAEQLGRPVSVLPEPQLNGALGAALTLV